MSDKLSKMPLWLDIKPQYIDENFSRVLEYIQNPQVEENDSFYKVTVELMEKRITELLDEQFFIPIYKDDEQTTSYMLFTVRLFAAYLLLGTRKSVSDYSWFTQVYIIMLKNLLSLTSKDMSLDLIMAVTEAISGKVSVKMPYSWNDLKEFKPDIFAYKIINFQQKNNVQDIAGIYVGKGYLYIDHSNIYISAYSKQESARMQLVTAISAFEGKFNLLSLKTERVKQSELKNIDALEEFTRNFISNQRCVSIVKKRLKTYEDGDEFDVRVVAKEGLKVKVKSIDSAYESVIGLLTCNSLQKLGYTERDFYNYLNIDDIVRVKYINGDMDISDDIKKYIVECAAQLGDRYAAKVNSISLDSRGMQKIYMWTSEGFPVQCFKSQCHVDNIQIGDVVDIVVTSHGKDNFYGIVNVEVTGFSEEIVENENSKKNLIQNAVYDVYKENENNKENELSSISIKALCLMLIRHQKSLSQPSDRYKIICIARVLAELIDNRIDSNYIVFISEYLENLVRFAKGNYYEIKNLHPSIDFAEEESVIKRISIIKILKTYGRDESNEFLDEIIKGSSDSLLKKVAILVQSCNRIDDVISKAMQNVIKREITKNLAIETEGETDLEEENGSYLGIENNRQEFKTSFFYAPSTSKEQRQEINVFKGVCAFLNSSSGGILYIGVNDLGYVNGITSDLEYLKKNVYGAYSGIDGYIRYITDRAKVYFGLGVTTHIEINAIYDNQVIALNIRPYEFNIVELENVPYLRLNNESVIMTDSVKRQLIGKRVLSNKDKAAIVSMLLEAIKDNRKVVLKNYSSSNSGTILDRYVEPYAFTENYKQIWCYDLNKNENRIFNTARIGNVEILEEKCTCTSLHKQGKLDVFGMTGLTPIKVILELGMMSRNILIEEYPQAKKFILQKNSTDKWILDVDVYSIEGVARFYIGLAKDIKILQAPELKRYVQEYQKCL